MQLERAARPPIPAPRIARPSEHLNRFKFAFTASPSMSMSMCAHVRVSGQNLCPDGMRCCDPNPAEACTVRANMDFSLRAVAFDTDEESDILNINGIVYSGSLQSLRVTDYDAFVQPRAPPPPVFAKILAKQRTQRTFS